MLSLTRQIFAAAILLGILGIHLTARSQAQADKKETNWECVQPTCTFKVFKLFNG